jgi:hypothetical protein
VIDFNRELTTVYYIMTIGINLSYFFLIIFNEVWLISVALYTPMLAYFLWKTGRELEGEENTELAIRCFFCALLYAATAYRVEYLNKMAFIGKENSEKTFYRWLKIFETFPEGLALIRKNHLLYANKSLPEMLELGDFDNKSGVDNTELQRLLNTTEIQKMSRDESLSYTTSVWGFLRSTEKGAPFALNLNQ